jgi:hypothetical protein
MAPGGVSTPRTCSKEWKEAREGDAADELDKLDWLNRQRLQELMTEAIVETKDELVTAIDKVHDVSRRPSHPNALTRPTSAKPLKSAALRLDPSRPAFRCGRANVRFYARLYDHVG